ncbi:MAG TPA: prephenate dehydrogenase/arogenate dehydrogenase family protein [Turneriella sp.]|nr:prephenate dehydrogenase/arogenate dehydrogenase family protein [Turneriella sp.]
MDHKPRIFIWGMGLIGASLGLKLKSKGYCVEGAVRSEKSRAVLKQMGFEKIYTSNEESLNALYNADILVLGLTLSDSLSILDLVFSSVIPQKRLIVFDTCSTKRSICNFVKEKYPDAPFVGVHPMAGKETSGPGAADAELYANATVYIVPRAQSAIHEKVEALWRDCGAVCTLIDAAEHDRLMAYMSHGLHLNACLLARMANDVASIAPTVYPGAGSFRDMTRIASSSGALWQEIVLSNKDNVVHWLKKLSTEADVLADKLEQNTLDIPALFHEANEARERIMRTL